MKYTDFLSKNKMIKLENYQTQKKSHEHLRKHIINLSEANTFEKAVLEWVYIYKYDYKSKMGHCACQNKIMHGYTIRNILNGNMAEVGSSYDGCCKYFPNIIATKKILRKRTGIAKYIKDIEKMMNDNLYEKITDIRQYSNDCFERLCMIHFNNISTLSIKQCDDYINQIDELNIIHPRLLKLKTDIIQHKQNKIKYISSNMRRFTIKQCKNYIHILDDLPNKTTDIFELEYKLKLSIKKKKEWAIKKREEERIARIYKEEREKRQREIEEAKRKAKAEEAARLRMEEFNKMQENKKRITEEMLLSCKKNELARKVKIQEVASQYVDINDSLSTPESFSETKPKKVMDIRSFFSKSCSSSVSESAREVSK